MNRSRPGGPSKASATTLCQKCLKRGHYSYECTAAQQERPYKARPSRTQQLLNPKLAPKITEAVPKTDETKLPKDTKSNDANSRGRKRTPDESDAPDGGRKRSRSYPSHSSDSVSTISTNKSRSRSRSPPPGTRNRSNPVGGRRGSVSHQRRTADKSTRYRERSYSPNPSKDGRSRSPTVPRSSDRRNMSREGKLGTRASQRRSRSRGSHGDASERGHNGTDSRKPGRPVGHDIVASRERSMSPYSRRRALLERDH